MILALLVSWFRLRARRADTGDYLPATVRSIVIVELTRLGDVVTVIPSLRRIRQNFPDAKIYVVVDSSLAPLITLCEPGVEVLGITHSATPRGFLAALRRVRRLHADLACSMSPANRNAALALASRARFIAGYLAGNDSLTPFLHASSVESIGFKGIPAVLFDRENIQERPGKVLQALGIRGVDEAAVPDTGWFSDKQKMNRTQGGNNGNPYIVIHPFSGWFYRSWPLSAFEEFALMALKNHPHEIVFICHESEANRLDPLRQAFSGEHRVRFLPSDSLIDTASILFGADAFVGNDSGPLHLAALLGVPVVGLFGPAPPALTAPLSARGTSIYHPVPCSPCDQKRCVRPANSCMTLITPGEVGASLREVIAPKHTRGAVHA